MWPVAKGFQSIAECLMDAGAVATLNKNARWRSATSRYYYAAFHAIGDYLERETNGAFSTRTSHEKFWDEMGERGKRSATDRKLHQWGTRLYEARKRADYRRYKGTEAMSD